MELIRLIKPKVIFEDGTRRIILYFEYYDDYELFKEFLKKVI
jgi:hypothetical protein